LGNADGRFQQPEDILRRLFGLFQEMLDSGDHQLISFLHLGILDELDHEDPAFEILLSHMRPAFPRLFR
jgi:hypothetical protein